MTQVAGSGTELDAALVSEAETTFPGPPAWVRLNIIVAGVPLKTPPVTVPDNWKPISFVPRSISLSVVRVSVNGPAVPVHVFTMGVASVMSRPGPLRAPYVAVVGVIVRGSKRANPDMSPRATSDTAHVEPSRSSAVDVPKLAPV